MWLAGVKAPFEVILIQSARGGTPLLSSRAWAFINFSSAFDGELRRIWKCTKSVLLPWPYRGRSFRF